LEVENELETMDIVQSNDNYISVLVRQEGYAGGAHGYRVVTSFNYDVKNHKEFTLTDFMTLEKASEASRADLKPKFEQEGNDEIFTTFTIDGTDPKKPENFSVFTFLNNSVTIYFGEYQVAPYAVGEQKVTLPR
jgi:hypothetical protein